MSFQAFPIACAILLFILLIFILYKLCWYAVKLSALRSLLKDYNEGDVSITFLRKPSAVVFGKKGETDFTVKTPKGQYAVSILSFVSANSRWNIEKTRHSYFAESRRRNNIFYRVEKHSGTEPEFARDYRRETRLQRAELHLSSEKNPTEKKILLIYPRPLLLTYTDTSLNYLNPGDKIEDYEIMYADELIALLETAG